MTAVCAEQRSPAEAQGRGDSGRGTALTWRYDVCQGPVTLAEFDHDCRMTCWYVRGVGVAEGIGDILAEVEVSGENPKPHYYLYNHRADVLVVLNSDGAANSTFRYDAFGNYYQMTGPFTPRYTFSTKEYLPAAALYLYQYRAYDPIAGRWTQRDPIDYQDSINLYQFCGNNPVNATDPNGKCIQLGTVAIGAIVGGAAGALAGALRDRSWKGAGKGFLAGAVGGAVAGLTFNPALGMATAAGIGSFSAGVCAGVASGGAAAAAGALASESFDYATGDTAFTTENLKESGKGILQSTVIGAVAGGAMGGLAGACADITTLDPKGMDIKVMMSICDFNATYHSTFWSEPCEDKK